MARVAETLLKRARSKFFSRPVATALAALGSPLERSYRNTVYCAAELRQENGKITGVYCGNRWCLVCNRIRTARAIKRYTPALESWDDAYFVTLTRQNVPALELPATIAGMVAETQAIKLQMRRTDRVKLVGLRKLECTHNAETDEYHPHFHFVVQGRRAAGLLLEHWLERFPDGVTDRRGQDMRPIDKRGINEFFKYFTKLVVRKQSDAGGAPRSVAVPPVALDVIFRAMIGRRVYQPVGFQVAADAPDENGDIAPDTATDALSSRRAVYVWHPGATDWVDPDTGECLSGYSPGERFRVFVSSFERGPPAPAVAALTHSCAVPGCPTLLPPALLLCRPHWAKIGRRLTRRLYTAWNSGAPQSDYDDVRRDVVARATAARILESPRVAVALALLEKRAADERQREKTSNDRGTDGESTIAASARDGGTG